MPRRATEPKPRTFRSNGRTYARIWIGDKFHQLGGVDPQTGEPLDPEDFEARRRAALAAWHARHPAKPYARQLTMAELCELHIEKCEREHADGWTTRGPVDVAKYAALAVIEEHASCPVDGFGPRALAAIRARLCVTPCDNTRGKYRGHPNPPTLSESEIRRRIVGIRTMLAWAVSEELAAPFKNTRFKLPPLRYGQARQTERPRAAEPEDVRPLIAALRADGAHGAADVLELNRWIPMRPGEACKLEARNIVETPDGPAICIYAGEHKTKTGDRILALAGRALEIVQSALTATRSTDPRRPLFLNQAGGRWTEQSYRQRLHRCADAHGLPRVLPKSLRPLGLEEAFAAGASLEDVKALAGHSPASNAMNHYVRNQRERAQRAGRLVGSRERA